ncbi:hypothetical protein WJX77_005178 [Trebouxia sp. C0004]
MGCIHLRSMATRHAGAAVIPVKTSFLKSMMDFQQHQLPNDRILAVYSASFPKAAKGWTRCRHQPSKDQVLPQSGGGGRQVGFDGGEPEQGKV